jgi:hypothetical protein
MPSSEILMFMHCRQCLAELPKLTAPRDWAMVEVGLTDPHTLRVWCRRHEILIADFRIEHTRMPDCAGPGHAS